MVYQEVLLLVAGRCLGLFYSDGGVVGLWDPECLQGALNLIIGIFCQYGLVANVMKSKAMTCHTGTLRSGILEEAVGRGFTDRGETYREQLRRRIPCPYCGLKLASGLMTAYRWQMHWTEPEIYWNRFPFSQMEHIPQVFDSVFPKGTP